MVARMSNFTFAKQNFARLFQISNKDQIKYSEIGNWKLEIGNFRRRRN